MSRRSRKRRRATVDKASEHFSRVIALPERPLAPLTAGQVAQIDAASRTILREIGVRFNEPEAVGYFARVGAKIGEGNQVFIDDDLLTAALATAPESYTLHARNLRNSVEIGNRNCAVMPGGGPPFVYTLEGERRPGTLEDVANFAKLSQQSPEVHVMARKATEAQDVDAKIRHLDCWQTVLELTDKPAQSGFVGGREEAEDALQMLAAVFGSEAAIDGRPVAHCSVNVNSPLLYDRPMLESLIAFAKLGQPVLITPFVMAGVSGPATLAGAIAQHNAEVLAGVVLTQLIRPGTPVLYGTATSNVDLRSGAPAIGSPESAVSISVCAQLARHYGLPCRGGGALTDAPIPDAQANYERMMTLLTSLYSGVNFLMQGLGIIESYLTLSYAQFVIDLELLQMMREIARPFEVSEETLALEAIAEVGAGGHFLGAAHTMRHYRKAHFLPQLSVRQTYEQWQEAGGQGMMSRAAERCRELLDGYERPEIDNAAADRLHNFVARRKRGLLG